MTRFDRHWAHYIHWAGKDQWHNWDTALQISKTIACPFCSALAYEPCKSATRGRRRTPHNDRLFESWHFARVEGAIDYKDTPCKPCGARFGQICTRIQPKQLSPRAILHGKAEKFRCDYCKAKPGVKCRGVRKGTPEVTRQPHKSRMDRV